MDDKTKGISKSLRKRKHNSSSESSFSEENERKRKKHKRKHHKKMSHSTSDNSSDDRQKKKKKKSKHKKKKDKKKNKCKEKINEGTESGEDCFDVPISLMTANKEMAPMTKAEWEKKQSVVKRVFDELSGRHRLIKGDGEVIEEIVSKDRHKEINQQATRGDCTYFQSHVSTVLKK